MSIVIKEIILSDTLEKFMEKVNFNFDQLMLAGGGPPGPIGPSGPIGPAGPKGDPGNKWYVGGTGTTIALGATLYQGDLFLADPGLVPGGTWGPLGQIYEWNDATDQFDDTNVNIRGPQGAQGIAGSNLGFSTFLGTGPTGTTTATVYTADIEDIPGPTANFNLMKADTTWVGNNYPSATGGTGNYIVPANTGITSGYSRDVMWLGGQISAQTATLQYSLNRMPKIFIAPRARINRANYDQVFNPVATPLGGKAGGGIALGYDGDSLATGGDSGLPNSHSHIFIDDGMNLRLTNFTWYAQAKVGANGVSNNILSLESMSGIQILGGGYGNPSRSDLGFIAIGGSGSYSGQLTYPDSTVFDDGQLVLNTAQNATNTNIRLEIPNTGQAIVIGGGDVLADMSANYPNMVFTAGPSSTSGKYLMAITDGNLVNETNWLNNGDNPGVQYIESGTTGGSAYIGFGNYLTGPSGTLPSLLAYRTGAVVGVGPTAIDPTWFAQQSNNMGEGSLDIQNRLRIRQDGGTTAASPSIGNVLVSEDNQGTAIWTNQDNVGVWRLDDSCSSKIVINGNRYASFINTDNPNYLKVDFAVDASVWESDVFFSNYQNGVGTGMVEYGFQYNSNDTSGDGQLQIKAYNDITNCPPSLGSPSVNGARTIATFDTQGRIYIGSNNSGGAVNANTTEFANDKVIVTSNQGTADGLGQYVEANINLTNDGPTTDYESPLIKITYDSATSVVSDNGKRRGSKETALEIVRNANSVNGGPMNIRFKGVGKAETTKINGSADQSAQTGASGGAHVLMISDHEGATARDGVAGKTNDFYEIGMDQLFVDRIRLNYAMNGRFSVDTPPPTNVNQQSLPSSVLLKMKKWSDSSGEWGLDGPFKGSIQEESEFTLKSTPTADRTTQTASGGDEWPNVTIGSQNAELMSWGGGSNGGIAPNVPNCDVPSIIGAGSPKPENASAAGKRRWVNWISPSSSFRFAPMNVSKPSGYNQTGLAMVNFNIDMGFIYQTNEIARGANIASGGTAYGSLHGPGIVTTASRYDSGVGGDLMDTPKLQSFRIKLDDAAVKGLSPWMPKEGARVLDQTRNTFDPDVARNNGLDQFKNFKTDWMPGVCRAMDSQLESNDSTDYDNLTAPDAQSYQKIFRLKATGGGSSTNTGVNDWPILKPFANVLSNGVATPGENDAWAQTNLTRSTGGLAVVPDGRCDYANKYQMASISWRLECVWNNPPLTNQNAATTINSVYLHIMVNRTPNQDIGSAFWTRQDPGLIKAGNANSPSMGFNGPGNDEYLSYGEFRKFGTFQPNGGNDEARNLHWKYSAHTFSFPGCYQASGDQSAGNPYFWKDGPVTNIYSDGNAHMDQKFKLAISNSYGVPFNFMTLPWLWQRDLGGGNLENLTLNALMTQYQRNDSFYKSHGMGFSGGGIIRWAYVQKSNSMIATGGEETEGVSFEG